MVSEFPNKYIASSEGLRTALAKAKRFERIARQTDAPAPPEPPSSSEVIIEQDNEQDSSSVDKH